LLTPELGRELPSVHGSIKATVPLRPNRRPATLANNGEITPLTQ
jgi:hypothetical protein